MNRYKRGLFYIGILALIYSQTLWAESLGQTLERQNNTVNDQKGFNKILTRLSVEETDLFHYSENAGKNREKTIANDRKIRQEKIHVNDVVIAKNKKISVNKGGRGGDTPVVSKKQFYQENGYVKKNNQLIHYNNQWRVERGNSLFNTLSQWTADAGWSLVWKVDATYQILSTATFSGDFTSAVKQLFSSSGMQYVEVYLCFYSGNKVLLVTSEPSS